MKNNKGVILLIGFSFLTGFGTYFVKISRSINPVQILFFRAALASIFLFIFALLKKDLKHLKIRHPLNTLIMGVTQGLSIYFFYAALEKTTITNAVLLTYTAPIFSALLSVIFLGEKIFIRTWIAIFLSIIGVFLVCDLNELKIGSDQAIGSIFALIGGFFYASMAISSKSLTEKTTPIYAAFWQYFIIFILTLFFITGITWEIFSQNIISLVYLGWAAGGLAFLLYMEGIKLVEGQKIQIITMTEIIVASLSGILLLGEKLSLLTVSGGTLIILGVIIATASKKVHFNTDLQ